jgi:integrase
MPEIQDLIGDPPAKDPLREDKLPPDVRACLVERMNAWQLCQLSLSLVLPLRPDEAAGLLVSDVNFTKGWLEIGTGSIEANFTKEKKSFKLPFPDELCPILKSCIAGRAEGPLLRSRKVMLGQNILQVDSPDELKALYEARLLGERTGSVQNEHDRKLLFRRLLRELGGVSEDALAREFKKLLAAAEVANGATFYTLRSSVTTGMHSANLPHLEMRYLTGHTVNDILNDYTPLKVVEAMAQYFGTIRPLLATIEDRARLLGLLIA